MSNTVVRQAIETIGILGVVGSLIFVGLEVRQNSIATRAQRMRASQMRFTNRI
jgi:hypothetical protein